MISTILNASHQGQASSQTRLPAYLNELFEAYFENLLVVTLMYPYVTDSSIEQSPQISEMLINQKQALFEYVKLKKDEIKELSYNLYLANLRRMGQDKNLHAELNSIEDEKIWQHIAKVPKNWGSTWANLMYVSQDFNWYDGLVNVDWLYEFFRDKLWDNFRVDLNDGTSPALGLYNPYFVGSDMSCRYQGNQMTFISRVRPTKHLGEFIHFHEYGVDSDFHLLNCLIKSWLLYDHTINALFADSEDFYKRLPYNPFSMLHYDSTTDGTTINSISPNGKRVQMEFNDFLERFIIGSNIWKAVTKDIKPDSPLEMLLNSRKYSADPDGVKSYRVPNILEFELDCAFFDKGVSSVSELERIISEHKSILNTKLVEYNQLAILTNKINYFNFVTTATAAILAKLIK